MLEKDLFPAVKAWLENQGLTVYAEVAFKGSNRVIDVVGLNETSGESVAVELKLSYNHEVQVQAQFNSSYFSRSFVAVPRKNYRNFKTSPWFGVLFVDGETVEMVTTPQSRSAFLPTFTELKNRLYLTARHQEIIGGSEITKAGLTGRKMVIDEVKTLLQQRGPLTLKEILAVVATPWQAPTASLRHALLLSPEIEVDNSRPRRYRLRV